MKPKSLIICGAGSAESVYAQAQRASLEELTELAAPPMSREQFKTSEQDYSEVEILFSSWGGPVLDSAFFAKVPRLKAVFYGAGSVKFMVTDEMWERGVRISSAFGANAISVAEFTMAQIILGLKRAWPLGREMKENRGRPKALNLIGGYRAKVGLVSLGAVGRRVAKLVKQTMEVDLLLYDPFVSEQQCRELGGEKVELTELFHRSDAVSLHAPKLPETEGLIKGEHFRAMRPYSVFVNTSRGAVVNEADLVACAQERPDLAFYLDVTEPEPPVKESALYDLPNVFVTPHIAGAAGNEHARLGQAMVDECQRFLAGEPLQWEIRREALARMA